MNQFSYHDRQTAGSLITERDDLLRQRPPEAGAEMDEALQGVHGAARHVHI